MQFEHVVDELKHSLSVLDRVTISNDGSVLDTETMPPAALLAIARCVKELRRVRTLVLETRLEFVEPRIVREINKSVTKVRVNILTGFETLDSYIRDEVLGKEETLTEFEAGLDFVAEAGVDLTAFVLLKPSQTMTDSEALTEANASIDYLVKRCQERCIGLTIRLNPMYAAKGSGWAQVALDTPQYKPPRLSDVLRLAFQKAKEGTRIYVGLSTEDLDESWGSYRTREDFSRELVRQAILFNNEKMLNFKARK